MIDDRETIRLLNRRVLAPLTFGMCLAFWCRVNISYAAIGMNKALGAGAETFGIGVGILFAAYALFEVPSSFALVRVGAPRWIALLLFVWGGATLATAFVPTPGLLYLARFLVGAGEAGYPAACAYCIANAYPVMHRSTATSRWLSATFATGALVGPVSSVLTSIDHVVFDGWQWLFIAGAVPTLALAFYALHGLERPLRIGIAHARETDSAPAASAAEPAARPTEKRFIEALRAPATLVYLAVLLLNNFAAYILIFWFPQIIKASQPTLSVLEIGLLASIPLIVAVPVNLLVVGAVRRSGDIRWHLAITLLVASAALVITLGIGSDIALACATVVGVCAYAICLVLTLSLPMVTLQGSAVAGAVALINSGGQIGAMLGPYVMGTLKQGTGSFSPGLYAAAAALLMAAAFPIMLGRFFPATRR